MSAAIQDGPVQHYAQELAQYTMRQFSKATAVLDDNKKERLAKLPGSHARVFQTASSPRNGSGYRILSSPNTSTSRDWQETATS
ncbi:hypothetical protein D9611_000356 [Ephemerocybe angulata]|uniref:Uncharacterized protein n=1 Tax=Ephemerocybe angulata TaxID=980116 RepID=A0A8H5F7Z9_9AGAR|nr:hypothetical protein D9611_000356 [Tulosesus angulatus]